MRCPEPDLDSILRLLDAAAWAAPGVRAPGLPRRRAMDPVDARRMAAACGLAWLAGARVKEMARLTVADWRPEGLAGVRLVPEGGGAGEVLARRVRVVPVLPRLGALVAARLADMAGAPPGALLLAEPAPWDRSPRGFLEPPDRIVAASGGAVASLADLAKRFAGYAGWNRADPEAAAWLAGRVGRAVVGRSPALEDMRKLLLANHPAPRGGPPAGASAR